ncbi:MAG: GNAT family N-acetyltransferase [Myxococcota bacterium]|nr:GNAT family N-acetyltransferase [Myxococcota bacterium]
MEIRTITDDEVFAYRESLLQTFGGDPEVDPGSEERLNALVDRSQTWAVFEGKQIVGTAASFKLDIGVPGGSLPIAGLTMVTVRPTHRRRGLLRGLMQRHLDDAKQRDYAVSGLWASEASIYGRFGYGVAAEQDEVTIEDTRHVRIAPRDFDELEWIDEARAREVLPAIYARATAQRPGILRRSAVWWHQRRFMETPWSREGASLRRHVIVRRGDMHVGYIVYRQQRVEGPSPGGKVSVVEMHGVDARAEATLWQFLLNVDLFHRVGWWNAPTDDVLPLIVNNPRLVARERSDSLWLRIEDAPAALRARRYTNDGVLRFTFGGGTFELVVEDGRATCAPTTRNAELDIDRGALGSLYLGGFTATRLARAGLVRGDARAIATAERLFTSPIAPWCAEVF